MHICLSHSSGLIRLVTASLRLPLGQRGNFDLMPPRLWSAAMAKPVERKARCSFSVAVDSVLIKYSYIPLARVAYYQGLESYYWVSVIVGKTDDLVSSVWNHMWRSCLQPGREMTSLSRCLQRSLWFSGLCFGRRVAHACFRCCCCCCSDVTFSGWKCHTFTSGDFKFPTQPWWQFFLISESLLKSHREHKQLF